MTYFFGATLQDKNKNQKKVVMVASSYYDAQEKLKNCIEELGKKYETEFKLVKDLHECYAITSDALDTISKYNGLD